MLVIGQTRWQFQVKEERARIGTDISFIFSLKPEFKCYEIRKPISYLNDTASILDNRTRIQLETLCIRIHCDSFYLRPIDKANIINQGVDKLSSELITILCNKEVIKNESSSKYYDKLFLTELTKKILIQACKKANPSIDEDIHLLDMYDRSEYRTREQVRGNTNVLRFGDQTFNILNFQMAIEALGEPGIINRENPESVKRSMDLLYSMLKPDELEEAKSKETVTVFAYDKERFVVKIKKHALVRQYNWANNYVQSHCVVFEDYRIPVGDEVLMKLALLKNDIHKFLKLSNKRRESSLELQTSHY